MDLTCCNRRFCEASAEVEVALSEAGGTWTQRRKRTHH